MAAIKTTQDFVTIKEIRDGVVVMRDNSMRMILIASSINFALKSKDEQEAVIYQYQSFLNSLDFHLQIHLQSRKLDINPYVSSLEERMKEQTNDLIKVQTKEYIEFIRSFVESTDIMTKSFFIVIPYSPSALRTGGNLFDKLGINWGDKKNKSTNKEIKSDNFEEAKNQLEQRVDVVKQGLNRCGVKTEELGTEELIELYFKTFNPGESGIPNV